jgi:hypothetical protein
MHRSRKHLQRFFCEVLMRFSRPLRTPVRAQVSLSLTVMFELLSHPKRNGPAGGTVKRKLTYAVVLAALIACSNPVAPVKRMSDPPFRNDPSNVQPYTP